MGLMILFALAGGIVGSYFGAKKFDNRFLNKLLAVVLIIASIKLIIT
jgi:hypothetical protein